MAAGSSHVGWPFLICSNRHTGVTLQSILQMDSVGATYPGPAYHPGWEQAIRLSPVAPLHSSCQLFQGTQASCSELSTDYCATFNGSLIIINDNSHHCAPEENLMDPTPQCLTKPLPYVAWKDLCCTEGRAHE